MRRKVPLTYGATFDAQQCAEKYLKAILVARGKPFPRTHDLIALTDLCLASDVLIPFDQDLLPRLAAYATLVRYPGDDPSPDEAREALSAANAVRRFARAWLRTAQPQPYQ